MDPFAPVSAAPQASASALTAKCGHCGTPVDPSRAAYGSGGKLVCPRCEAEDDVRESTARVATSLKGSAYACAGVGFVSLLCNPFLVASVLALMLGIGTLAVLVRQPEYRRAVGAHLVPMMIAAGLGTLCALVHPVILLLALVFSGAAAAVG